MRTAARVVTVLMAAQLLSGCIAAAAAVPLAAGGLIARKGLKRGADERRAERGQVEVAPALPVQTAPAPVQTPAPPASPPPTMQYLYGSGEAAALSLQSYQALWRYLEARAGDRLEGRQIAAVVLAEGSTLAAPQFASCGDKPLAVVFDIDETLLLNLGYERDEAMRGTGYDDARWKRWEATGVAQVAAVPGAVEAVQGARRLNIAVVFNSNRSEGNAEQTIAALDQAGLGKAELGKTLWLRGEGPGSSGKDARRWAIAERYCVVALVGDQLGDFSDLFNAPALSVAVRRNSAAETMVAPLWGAGWFILPNPVYGPGLKGGFDDVFPADKRWTDPADAKPEPQVSPAAQFMADPAPKQPETPPEKDKP